MHSCVSEDYKVPPCTEQERERTNANKITYSSLMNRSTPGFPDVPYDKFSTNEFYTDLWQNIDKSLKLDW